jgi:hypothetical protein
MPDHPQSCRCRLHTQITAVRYACYQQLARAILGPLAPSDDSALAHALAEHARLIASAAAVSPISSRRAA